MQRAAPRVASASLFKRLFFAPRRGLVQRLKTRAQFQAVLAASPIAKTPHFALYRCPLVFSGGVAAGGVNPGATPLFSLDATWLGAMAPKRWAKRAVTRNSIKRQTYAVAADFSSRLPKAAFVVRLRREFARTAFTSASSSSLKLAIRDELMTLFESGVLAP